MSLTGPPDRVLVIGPGAIGGIVAARLSNKGLDVTVATRTTSSADALAAEGITATDPDGRPVHGDVKAIVAPEELTDEPHLVVLATKCQDAVGALKEWIDAIPPHVPVVSMQNGIMGPELQPIAGDRYVDCVVAFAATLEKKGLSHQTGPGEFILGAWPTSTTVPDHVLDTARRLNDVVPVKTSTNMVGAKWTKLIVNSAITTLGVVANTTLGELMEDERARSAFLAITTEGYRAGAADGVEFETISGFKPGMIALPDDPGALSRWWRNTLLKVIGRRHSRHRSSSLQSLERGRKTEVDHLNARIVETATKHGIDAPVNAALVDIVHEIEAGKREPGMANLADIPGIS